VLFTGEHAKLDMNRNPFPVGSWLYNQRGNPLCSWYPFRGILWKIRSDLDYQNKELYLPAHGSAKPCAWCPCTTGTHLPLDDFRENAEWHGHVYDNMAFLASLTKINPLFLVTGVLNYCLAADWMHVKHMGIDQYYAASVIWLLVFILLPGRTEI